MQTVCLSVLLFGLPFCFLVVYATIYCFPSDFLPSFFSSSFFHPGLEFRIITLLFSQKRRKKKKKKKKSGRRGEKLQNRNEPTTTIFLPYVHLPHQFVFSSQLPMFFFFFLASPPFSPATTKFSRFARVGRSRLANMYYACR